VLGFRFIQIVPVGTLELLGWKKVQPLDQRATIWTSG
jgi:hypothetical protein